MLDRRQVIIKLGELIYGKIAKDILTLLYNEGELTDEQIANRLGISVNDVRKILHKLYEHMLVKYKRTRDPNVGWYTYYWKLTDERPELILEDRKRKVIAKLKELLNYEESNTFFYCDNCKIRYTYNEALANLFQCPRCGNYLIEYDNTKIKEFLRELIDKLRNIRFD